MEITETLKNSHVDVEFNPKDHLPISGHDHDDRYNYPAFYIENKRGAKKQWEILKSKFNEKTTFNEVCIILLESGSKIHSWCTMD